MTDKKIEALWTHLHWLTVLATQGSYTSAAQRLGVSKAAMSQRISELERAAGVSLVQRTTRSVRLTEAGRTLVDEMQAPYQQIADCFANVRDFAGVARGVVRVTAPVAFARQQLVSRLPAFLHAHPQVRIQLEMTDRLAALANEGFDLAIRHSVSIPDTHVASLLCTTRSVIAASPAYLARRGVPETPEALANHDCLFYPRAQDATAWTFEKESHAGTAGILSRTAEPTGRGGQGGAPPETRCSVRVNGPFSANNSEALRDAALGDLGIALLPDFTAESALRSGHLIRVLPAWLPVGTFASELHLVRPYATHVPQAVSAFVAYLKASFAQGFGGGQ